MNLTRHCLAAAFLLAGTLIAPAASIQAAGAPVAVAPAAGMPATGVPATGVPATGITTRHGTVLETQKAGLATKGFLEIDNAGSTADTLTAISCPIADSSHLVTRDGSLLPQLAIASGQHLRLAADGPHLQLAATHFSIDQGSAIPCSLTFQNAGEILLYLYATPSPSA